jgi:hypothetical protein
MNDEVIADLKQFMTSLLSQQFGQFRIDFGQEIRAEIQASAQQVKSELGQQIEDLSDAIAEALEATNEDTGQRLNNHERRLKFLEARTA